MSAARRRWRGSTASTSCRRTRARSACRPAAQEAYRRLAGEIFRYPDGGALDLRRAIGARFGLDPARIVCGAGSDDLIYQLCLAYGGAGRDIVMTEHGFSIYHIAGTYAGSRVDQDAASAT